MQTYSCNAFNTTGIDSFKVFFPKSQCIFIAQCTNERIDLHNIQQNATIPHTDEGEVMILLGLIFVMCYNRLPNLSDYWSSILFE